MIEMYITIWCLIGIAFSVSIGHFIQHEMWDDFLFTYRWIKKLIRG